MIRRAPDGKYCNPWFALDAWLPRLMNQAQQSTIFSAILTAMALYCIRQAAEEYRIAGTVLSSCGASTSMDYTTSRHMRAVRWFKKRDILLQVVKDIEAVDRS